jgi:DNA polymerase-3 subunit epsilon
VHEINYELTGSEFIALLFESAEIKKYKPIYNRMQRKSLFNIGLMAHYDLNGYICFNLERISTKSGLPLASFANMTEAKNYLFKQVEKYQLCQKLCGLYKTEGACFHSNVGICRGACTGVETSMSYNIRAQQLLDTLNFENQNFIVIDKGRQNNEKAVILVKNGKYLGFGFADSNYINNLDMLEDCIQKYQDNRDSQQIIKSFLRTKKFEKLISL